MAAPEHRHRRFAKVPLGQQPRSTPVTNSPKSTAVSFVVPTFKRPDTLRATLDALIHLDYPKDLYEVIVVDDGSGDSTRDVVVESAAAEPSVRYIAQENTGVARARNVG